MRMMMTCLVTAETTTSNRHLNSADDDDGPGRTQDQDEYKNQDLSCMDAEIVRHAIPEPSDGELYFLKVPRFLNIEPTRWNPKTFQPPTTDHHSKTASETFSAYNTAMTTVRWRHSRSDPKKLQSNARVLRWSDGSLTLQFASDPITQYEMSANALAPPQHNPKIPTPTSIRYKPGQRPPNQATKESYTYLAAPSENASLIRITNKLTTTLMVNATANDSKDSALLQLQSALAASANKGREEGKAGVEIVNLNEDPELARAKEEAQYKEKLKSDRAKQRAEEKQQDRNSRAFGRSGARRSYGLSLGGLEDEGGVGRGGVRKPRKTGLRRDWSDDEDYGIRGRTREDEYDEEDDFIAGSDEEEEVVQNVSRAKRRRVVEDDDEDE
ncbi:hypothetical protein GQ43DRAFT_134213 [Delitschia confertaspora ATCC 74209]|uniref:Leo1-like protein n=1 Tax=Delitschia confertaspora ATCC 74209 TaxID=1513339 RepID=A0A9P4JGY8_9PLEO|nr:hypothetical protein GQ43DRAFT_134213 [Delitschia confertaspora ATCC 74209]